jgi:CRISPR/Cas system Type II protein with McrA/HNH and RuvC-like nuclease domain
MSLFSGYHKLIEEKIQDAIRRGEFDNLPGRGEPLELEDDSHLPDDLRLAYKILKNADCLPPELQLRKDIRQTEELLAGIQDTREKYRQLKKLNFMIMKLNMMRRVSPLLEEGQRYYEKVVDKISKA